MVQAKKKFVTKSEHSFLNKHFRKLKDYLFLQEEKIVSDKKKQLVFFILGFVLFYLIIMSIVLIIPAEFYKSLTGQSVQFLLGLEGIASNNGANISCTETNWIGAEINSNCYSFSILNDAGSEKIIQISWLCTGILEIIVLASAILSSFGVSLKKKLVGIVCAIIIGVIFNLLRILITVNIILGQNTMVVELAHDVLFRLILFVYITGFYVAWFYWSQKTK